MLEKLKAVKVDVTLGAVITVALGIAFLIWPMEAVSLMARVIAAAIIATGVLLVIFELTTVPVNLFGTGAGALIAIVGLWFFIKPTVLTNFIPIVVGIWLIIHGIRDLMMTVEGRRYKAGRWLGMGVMALISIAFGVFCICYAFELVKATMVILGIMLIVDGFTDMVIVHKVNKASKIFAEAEGSMSGGSANYSGEVIDATDDVKPLKSDTDDRIE